MSTKLSQKLERINSSVSRIRQKVELPNAVIEDVATAVEQLSTSGGEATKTNIYKVATIEERDAITDMVEGDLCVIHYNSVVNMSSSDSVSEITFPATVVLPSAVSGSLYTMLESEDGSTMIDLSLSSSRMRATIMGDDYVNLSYSSSNGKTYTLSGGADKVITSSSPIKCTSGWNDMFGYFMQVGGAAFDGIYEYKDGAWDYANLGLNPDLSTIFPSTTVYTNSGFQSGFFPLKNGSWNSLFAADSVKVIQDAMHNLDNHTRLFAGAMSTTAIIDIFNKVLKGDCSYLFNSSTITELDLSTWDFSNVTSLKGAFSGMKNLTSVNLQNADLSNMTDFNDTFLASTALTTVDFRGATFSSEKINVSGMFENMNIEHILFDEGVKLKVNTLSAFEGMNNSLGPTDEAAEAFLKHVDDSELAAGALNYAFRYCSRLTRLDFSHLDLSNLTGIVHGLMHCDSLQFLDLRTVDFQKFTNTDPNVGSFASCLTNIPTNCLIIVGDATQKSILQSKRTALTNIKTVAEYGG